MTIDQAEAAAALDAVARTRNHALELRHYAGAGGILIAWGLAWLAGNLVTQFAPQRAVAVWAVAIATTVAYTMLSSRAHPDWRIAATVAALLGFFAFSTAIVRASPAAQTALISLIVALAYIMLGIWTGRRFAWLGLVLAAVIAIGWFVVPQWLPLCLALGGGGTLVAGGLWLRRA